MTLKDLTPISMRCAMGSCPAVYEDEDRTHLLIVGKIVERGDFASRIGPGECLVRVNKKLLHNVGGPLSRLLMRVGL